MTKLLFLVLVQVFWTPTAAGELDTSSDLISDNRKRGSMERCVENNLQELEKLIASARNTTSDPILDSFQTTVASIKAKTVSLMGDVDSLGREIVSYTVVPNWFMTDTKLCYKWMADGDGGQCGGGAQNELCATPNSMTPVYIDNTDDRGGGCRMQWGIHSTGYPSWFNNVRICYRWYADVDGGQCGSGAAQLLCAAINQFSPDYRDDTDRRPGGCRMSWMIEVPSTAPLWMRNIKLCFLWYPNGDGGQCGGISSLRLCAKVNEWTEYYRDDTDGRPGGCIMSWGLITI